MNKEAKPSARVKKAARAIARGIPKLLHLPHTAGLIADLEHIIEAETAHTELLEAAKMAESSLFSLEACNLWMERDHQRLNQLRRAIAKAEAK